MSDELYPLGPLGGLDVQRLDRTISDEFEDGSTTARRLWTAKSFKRRFTVQHENLTEQEMRKLAAFFTARDGRYDSFWYRDNHNRGGSAKVRLAGSFPIQRAGAKVYSPQLILEQTAPVRELPDWDELVAAALSNPAAWYDANRLIYYSHNGTVVGDSTIPNLSLSGSLVAWSSLTEQSGLISPHNASSYAEQWQAFYSQGSYWLRGDSVSLSGTQPAVSLFFVCKVSTVAAKQVLVGLGAVSSGAAVGIAINATNEFEPWLGGAEVWTNAQATNVADTWHSVAVVFTSGSNNATLYVDGVLIGTDAVARSYTAGRCSLFAAPDGTLKAGSGLSNCRLNHVIFHNGNWSLSAIQGMHNLFAHQYGMTAV